MSAPTAIADDRSFGELGPAMRAISPMQREFVYHLLAGKGGYGSLTKAATLAGYRAKNAETQHKLAWGLSRDEKVLAAISEEGKKFLRVAHTDAVKALLALVRDPNHRDHGRAVMAVIERADPAIARTDLNVTVRNIDPDQEALEELRALRKVGATREKLLELYGANGLDRIEELEARENAVRAITAKTIEGEVVG
jgi:hypothetical protein